MTIIHLSDIHVWRLTWDPRRWANKRAVGLAALLAGRARRFHRERLGAVVEYVRSLPHDHVLITGDLSTTALPEEFLEARQQLAPLLDDPARVTILPGNHDRYTGESVRSRCIRDRLWRVPAVGELALAPIARCADRHPGTGPHPRPPDRAADGCRKRSSNRLARGWPSRTGGPTASSSPAIIRSPRLLLMAASWPANGSRMRPGCAWLATIGRHLYCCGHVHAAWAFSPPGLPDQLCLNAGAPLYRERGTHRRPGFLEIQLEGDDVHVLHHQWSNDAWTVAPLAHRPGFFS